MRRRAFIALIPNLAVPPGLGFAQEPAKVARIGFLGPTPAASVAPRVEALRAGLRDLGYVEGKNLIFEFRWAATPDQMPTLAADLIRAGADVIVALSSLETAAALTTTKTVPIVFTSSRRPRRPRPCREPRAAGRQRHRLNDAPYRSRRQGA